MSIKHVQVIQQKGVDFPIELHDLKSKYWQMVNTELKAEIRDNCH